LEEIPKDSQHRFSKYS